MAVLFEFDAWKPISNKAKVKSLLLDIWQQRIVNKQDIETEENKNNSTYQPFLQFDGDNVRANNYVGFIQNGEDIIEIFPKVFRGQDQPSKELMLKHIFYWFRYCRKWRFPFSQASLELKDINEFPELIIHLIANQMLETITKQPFQMYQELEEALLAPKGSINFKRYINNSLTRGHYQKVECDYEPFLFDNKVNSIIKYCARLLIGQTHFPENLRSLQEVIFILDEVEDSYCTTYDIDSINLNPFFEDYKLLLDSCKIVLSQQLYSSNTYDLTQWCLLFPMEYIFEDFIAGFLERNFSKKWKVEYQKSNAWLANKPQAFNMQHDIFLTAKDGSNRKVIVDTKYKIRHADYTNDVKKGISQNDLYQVTSYAFKRGCTEVFLIYPNITESINESDTFEIESGFPGTDKINVTAMEVPFWSMSDFDNIDQLLFTQLTRVLNNRK